MVERRSRRSRPPSLLAGPFFFEGETLLFIVLSVADLLMTYFLLRQAGDHLQFVEANPVARHFLNHWGVRGMVYFKFGMVALVCIVTQVIARYRPFTARLLLFFAIVVMIYVLVYSVRLYSVHAALLFEPLSHPIGSISRPL
jgi:hypothetical protein